MDSILLTVKKALGVEKDFDGFDTEIIFGINTAFMSLNQIGVGPEGGFSITDETPLWSDYIGTATDIEGVKTFVVLKTRLAFDPPTVSYLVDSISRQISELEWRLRLQVEPPLV